MNYLWEGLNPIYLIPVILLVAYLHIVGVVVNNNIKTSLPTVLMGFLISLIISSPFILPVHWGLTNYSKTLFLIPNIILAIFSFATLFLRGIKIKFNKNIIAFIAIAYLLSLIYFNRTPGTVNDYWLYGKWFSYGSNFHYAQGDYSTGYMYGLTIMYTWIGSFAGLVWGPVDQVSVWSLQIEWQTTGTLIWIAISMQILMALAPKIRLKTLMISMVIAIPFTTINSLFGYSFFGSFSISWLFLILLSFKDNYIRNTLMLIFGFCLMVSTTLVVLPLIASTLYVLNTKKNLPISRLTGKAHLIVPLIMITIIIISYPGHPVSTPLVLIVYVMRQYLVIVSSWIIMKYGSNKIKQVIVVNSFLALSANLILNYHWSLLQFDIMPGAIMHRYLSFMLAGERSFVLVTVITFPWAMHLLYEVFKSKKTLD